MLLDDVFSFQDFFFFKSISWGILSAPENNKNVNYPFVFPCLFSSICDIKKSQKKIQHNYILFSDIFYYFCAQWLRKEEQIITLFAAYFAIETTTKLLKTEQVYHAILQDKTETCLKQIFSSFSQTILHLEALQCVFNVPQDITPGRTKIYSSICSLFVNKFYIFNIHG